MATILPNSERNDDKLSTRAINPNVTPISILNICIHENISFIRTE